jgi:hypothetical protein
MPYLNCPHCGLSVRVRSAQLWISNCPRCLARQRRAFPMDMEDEPLRLAPDRLPRREAAALAQGPSAVDRRSSCE